MKNKHEADILFLKDTNSKEVSRLKAEKEKYIEKLKEEHKKENKSEIDDIKWRYEEKIKDLDKKISKLQLKLISEKEQNERRIDDLKRMHLENYSKLSEKYLESEKERNSIESITIRNIAEQTDSANRIANSVNELLPTIKELSKIGSVSYRMQLGLPVSKKEIIDIAGNEIPDEVPETSTEELKQISDDLNLNEKEDYSAKIKREHEEIKKAV
jgi:hypothetical protein